MRNGKLLSLIALILLATLVPSCAQTENKNSMARPSAAPTVPSTVRLTASPTTMPLVSQTAAPPVSQSKPLPPTGSDKPTEAEFNGYPYSYKKDGNKTVATFAPKFLTPGDDVAAAIRDVIDRSYRDKVTSAPRLVGSGAARSIRIAGEKHEYVVVPVTEPTGEIHSLIITQLTG